MKFLKGFLTFIIGVVLFILILGLSLISSSQNFIEKELIVSTVKETLIGELSKSEDLTGDQKSFIDKITKDKESDKIIKKIYETYISYRTDPTYNLTHEDYDQLINYIIKFREEINAIYKTNYTDANVREAIKYDDVKKVAKEAFQNMDSSVDTNEMNQVITVYTRTTSSHTKLIIIFAILFCISLILIINRSLFAWLKVVGIDFIISGIFIAMIFGVASIIKNSLEVVDDATKFIKGININGFIILAIGELIFGIVLIVVYKYFKNRGRVNNFELK